MTADSNGSRARDPQPPTHKELRHEFMLLLTDFVFSPMVDELVAGVDSRVAAARVADLRVALFPQPDVES